MKQTQPPQINPQNIKRRCSFRSANISWCKKHNKVCNSPSEYNLCPNYKPKPSRPDQKLPQNAAKKTTEKSPHALLIGVRVGQCDICKLTKKTLLLRYGFCLCEDCLNVCTAILEQLQLDESAPKAAFHKNQTSSGVKGLNDNKGEILSIMPPNSDVMKPHKTQNNTENNRTQ